MQTNISPNPLKWYQLWLEVLLHPDARTFSRIISSPGATVKLGMAWMAVAAIVAWYTGFQRAILWGWVIDTFGFGAEVYFYTAGAVLAALLAVLSLLFSAAVSRGIASLFNGAGQYKHLVYAWGIMQMPFILLSALLSLVPLPFSAASGRVVSPAGWLVQLVPLVLTATVILYLGYAEIVAFSAVEKFSLAKGFGVIFISTIVIAVAGTLLFYAFQALFQATLRI